MTYSTAPLAYRRAALQHASVVGLVVALHDTLIGNLQRAAGALQAHNIQLRCDELTHGFKVLTQLEAMLDMRNGGEKAVKISKFYNHLRQQMLAAQFKLDPEILYRQVRAVLEVRDAWQQVDENASDTNASLRTAEYPKSDFVEAESTARIAFSCSG